MKSLRHASHMAHILHLHMLHKMAIWSLCYLILSLFFANLGQTMEMNPQVSLRSEQELAKRAFMSVCPPFQLLTENGEVIDPSKDLNTNQPYSPKKTCGRCHDYERITSGYHFQQGKDEVVSPELKTMYAWMRSPGQYGGRY